MRRPLGLKAYGVFAILVGAIGVWGNLLSLADLIGQFNYGSLEELIAQINYRWEVVWEKYTRQNPFILNQLLSYPLLLASGFGVLLLRRWAYVIAWVLGWSGLLLDPGWYIHSDAGTLWQALKLGPGLNGWIIWYFLRPSVKAQFVSKGS